MSGEPIGDIAPGRVVGGYAIQGHLGGSAWAETYVAAAESGDLVALKVVDASIAKATGVGEGIERARASIVSLADHLVLRPVAAAEEEGVRFIATPLSEYPSLADLVDICPLSPSEAIGVVKNLAIAIEAAHAAGAVHLAIKPSNVFVGPPPTHAVKIADFGADALRRAKDATAKEPWLAPEQQHEDEAGPAADVFALARVAYFMIAGKAYAPNEGESTKPSALSADVPPSFDAPLLKALSEKPSERFASARDLAEALERALNAPLKEESAPKVAVLMPAPTPLSERHIKATQKLERFRLPAPVAPVIDRTVRLEKFDAPVAPPTKDTSLVPDSGPVEEKKTTRPVPGVPSINRTAKLEPAKIPEPQPLLETEQQALAHKRFYLPKTGEASSPKAPSGDAAQQVATVRPPPAETPAPSSKDKPTAKSPRAVLVRERGLATYVRRVQDAWTSGDKRQRQLVIAWAVFAFIALIAIILGAASIVRALTSSAPPSPSPSAVAALPLDPPPVSAVPVGVVEPPPPRNPYAGELEVVCVPECDKVYVNNNRMTAYPNAVTLDAGTYGVGVAKAGYSGQYLNVPVKAGEKQSVTFKLVKLMK